MAKHKNTAKDSKLKILEKMNSLNEKFYSNTDVFQWKGVQSYYDVIFAMYLSKKYDNVVMFSEFPLIYDTEFYANYNGENVNIENSQIIRHKLLYFFAQNISKRLLIIPINMLDHSNIIIIDTKKKEVELFDSHGTTYKKIVGDEYGYKGYYADYLKDTKKFISNIVGGKYKFYSPVDFFPNNVSIQSMEVDLCPVYKYSVNSEGFSLAWSYFYIETRVQNQDIPREKLVNDLIFLFKEDIKHKISNKGSNTPSKTDKLICKTIRSYALYLKKIDSQVSLVDKIKLNTKLFIRRYNNPQNLKKLGVAAVVYGLLLYDLTTKQRILRYIENK